MFCFAHLFVIVFDCGLRSLPGGNIGPGGGNIVKALEDIDDKVAFLIKQGNVLGGHGLDRLSLGVQEHRQIFLPDGRFKQHLPHGLLLFFGKGIVKGIADGAAGRREILLRKGFLSQLAGVFLVLLAIFRIGYAENLLDGRTVSLTACLLFDLAQFGALLCRPLTKIAVLFI